MEPLEPPAPKTHVIQIRCSPDFYAGLLEIADSRSLKLAEAGIKVTVSDICREALIRYAFDTDEVPAAWNLDDPRWRIVAGVEIPAKTAAGLKFG